MNFNQYRTRRPQRGTALLFVLILVLVSAAMIGALLYTTMTWNTLAYSKSNSERALELAEDGVNTELNYISVNTRIGSNPTFHSNAIQTGQPYPGQVGSLASIPGKWWVYTTVGASNTFTITCTAEVDGIVSTSGQTATLTGGARRTMQVSCLTGSLFALYSVFSLDPLESGQNGCFQITGTGGVVTVVGTVATDGIVQVGSNSLTYTQAYNANLAYSANTGKQFGVSPYYNVTSPIWFPDVADMIRNSFSATSAMTDANAWTWLSTAANNSNSEVRMYASGASGAMTASNTTTAVVSGGYPVSKGNLTNASSGDWTKANVIPGSSMTALIYPPGDYYFLSLSLALNNTEMIIDNAGLSVGGNPNNIPVRFWFDNAGNANDTIAGAFIFTNTNDNTTFRIFYGKDGNSLTMSNASAGYPGTAHGVIYAVTAENINGLISGMTGATVNFAGGSSASTALELDGCLIADQVIFSGNCKVVGEPNGGNLMDYGGGSGFTGNYVSSGGQ